MGNNLRRGQFDERKIRITLIEEMLGFSPASPDLFRQFIASKAPDAESREEEIEAKGAEAFVAENMCVFNRFPDGTPFLYDYHIKGFMKDVCGMLSRLKKKDEAGKIVPGSESAKLKAYKKIIDGLIFVYDRMIPIHAAAESPDCERPLRAQTAQGDRVCVACSETVPEGSTMELSILCMDSSHWKAVEEWLDYGEFRGLGQWRNSGKGRFTWEYI